MSHYSTKVALLSEGLGYHNSNIKNNIPKSNFIINEEKIRMTQTPILTIITVNLNNAGGLEKTIKSVINQSFTNFEFIIIDGDSSDGSKEVIKKYTNHINWWLSEPDKGIYNAMNKGIQKAHGKYCLFLNSGDSLYHTSTLQNALSDEPKADFLIGNLVYEETQEIKRYPEIITLQQFIYNTIGHPSTFIRTELFSIYNLYNEELKIAADLEFLIKTIIFGNCTTRNLNENIAYFNQRGISSKNIEQSQSERSLVLNSLIPQRILDDYTQLFQLKAMVKKKITPFFKLKIRLYKMIRG